MSRKHFSTDYIEKIANEAGSNSIDVIVYFSEWPQSYPNKWTIDIVIDGVIKLRDRYFNKNRAIGAAKRAIQIINSTTQTNKINICF